jgi:hypothetical protein
MKKNILLLSGIAVIGALSLTLSSLRAQTAAPATPPAPTSPSAPPPIRRPMMAHPRIRSAIRALEGAKLELQNAPHDFGGHRQEALDSCDKAIKELKEALEFVAKQKPPVSPGAAPAPATPNP